MRFPWLEASSNSEQFIELAKERYRMRLRRERREAGPWTDDPILQQFRFCNVHREHDKTTVWCRENVREPLRDDPVRVALATIAFRWFNRIEVGERILPVLLEAGWNKDRIRNRLKNWEGPIVTGAYMVKTPAKMNKLEGIIWCMDELLYGPILPTLPCQERLEDATRYLSKAPYLGPFMAYEVISDLRWTCLFEDAPDILTWANPGPGAARGLGWIHADDPKTYNRHRFADAQALQKGMQELLAQANEEWPEAWRPWEMREVEHWLCEYDKWRRGMGGQRLKRRMQYV